MCVCVSLCLSVPLCTVQGNTVRKASVPANVRVEAVRKEHEQTRAEMEAQARRYEQKREGPRGWGARGCAQGSGVLSRTGAGGTLQQHTQPSPESSDLLSSWSVEQRVGVHSPRLLFGPGTLSVGHKYICASCLQGCQVGQEGQHPDHRAAAAGQQAAVAAG